MKKYKEVKGMNMDEISVLAQMQAHWKDIKKDIDKAGKRRK